MDDFAKLQKWNLIPERTYDIAFLCWLIDSINHPDEEPGIRSAAEALLDLILQEERPERYKSVDIIRGYRKVMAIAVINDSIAVILDTGLIRLELLKTVVEVKAGLKQGELPAFLIPFSSVHAAVFDLRYRENGIGKDAIAGSVDAVILPEDLLSCMCAQSTPSSKIYNDYLVYLEGFCEKRAGCQRENVAQWDRFCYCGYFAHLEKQMPQAGTGWGYKNTAYGLQRWFCWTPPIDEDANTFSPTELEENLVRLYYQIETVGGVCELRVQCKAAAKKKVATDFLWEVYRAFSEAFREKGYVCEKKRFLGGQFTPVCSVAFEPAEQGDIIEVVNGIYQTVVSKLIAEKIK